MRKSTTTSFRSSQSQGFTLLEVMVAVAILAITIVPMLLLREESYRKAFFTQSLRIAQDLAQKQLSYIAMEVRYGEGSGEFENFEQFRYEYNVTLYDFAAGIEEGQEEDDRFFDQSPEDRVLLDEDTEDFGPLAMRHVELTIFYPSTQAEEGGTENEYIIDTYMPLLLTKEQYERKIEGVPEEE